MKHCKLAILTLTSFGMLMLFGCGGAGVTLDPAMQKAKIDSLIQVQSEALKDSVNRVCETRMSQEVVEKADSIIKAQIAKPKK